MPKLSLSMIVKNEENYLRECLESIKDIADEIIIVDTGSTDKTLEIAEEYNSEVYHFNWINDFSAARNYALSKSTGDWILYLDADERLSQESLSELRRLIDGSKKTGIKCLVNSKDSRNKNSQMMKYIRLFKNDSNIKFCGKAHEQIEESLLRYNYNIIDSNIEIIHLGYDVSEEVLREKAKRNLALLLEDYSIQKTPYLAYQIGNSYSALGEENKKNIYYAEALENNTLGKELRSICFLNLAEREMKLESLEKAKKYVDKGLQENQNHTLLNLVGSQVYVKLQEYKTALQFCKNAYLLNNEKSFKASKNTNQLIKIDELKIIYHGILISVISNEEEAFRYFLNALIIKNNNLSKILQKLLNQERLNNSELANLVSQTNKDNLELILRLLENYQHEKEKTEYLKKIHNEFYKNSKFLSYYGSFLITQNKIDLAQEILETAIELENYDPAIIFYLSSLYVKTNQFEKLIVLLEIAESAAQSNPQIEKNLNLLKEKLMPLLSNSLS
jgi:glycosyltransferase involved in cell wall biosynthesis